MADILKLYLYYNSKTGGNFLIDNPQTQNYLKFVTSFYVVNPNVTYIPEGLNFICVKNQNYTTVDITEISDPFDTNLDCLKFIVWTQPVPYSSKLRIWKKDDIVKMSFNEENFGGYTEFFFSPLYVLVDPRIDIKRIKYDNGDFKIKDNEPLFLFRNEYGFCIPDSNGTSLEKCIKQYTEREQPTILVEIRNINKKRIRHFLYLFIITLTILIILLGIRFNN